jgi:hypothetical protein
MPVAFNNDVNQDELARLWGSRVTKLTPQQTQMVVEILKELEHRRKRSFQLA